MVGYTATRAKAEQTAATALQQLRESAAACVGLVPAAGEQAAFERGLEAGRAEVRAKVAAALVIPAAVEQQLEGMK